MILFAIKFFAIIAALVIWAIVSLANRAAARKNTIYARNAGGDAAENEIVYILTNPSMPGMVKVGMTTQRLESRVAQLNSATGVPTPFKIHAFFMVRDSRSAERAAHRALRQFRVNASREFFAGDAEELTQIVGKTVAPGHETAAPAPEKKKTSSMVDGLVLAGMVLFALVGGIWMSVQ